MGQELAGARLGQPHEVFDLHIVVQLVFFIGRKRHCLPALHEVPDPLARLFRGFESHDLAGTERGDELNNFFVRSHTASFASTSTSGKPATSSNSHYGRFDPRRVRAPGLHAPQNRPLVGRVPSPGLPIWSIMRIAMKNWSVEVLQ